MDESLKAQLVKEHEIVDDKVIKTGKTFIGEEEFISQGKPRIFLLEKRPVKDLDGNITGIVGIAQDITDLKSNKQQQKKRIK